MKVAVIGGGSTYTPELVQGFGEVGAHLGLDDLVLQDIDEQRLDVVGGAAQRIARAHGYQGRLTLTTDLDAAIDGASAVLNWHITETWNLGVQLAALRTQAPGVPRQTITEWRTAPTLIWSPRSIARSR